MLTTKIKIKGDCCGCFACYVICPQQCISMHSDEEGFWYPKVDYDKCINCGKCIDVCPIIQNKKDIKNDPIAYACINKNESARLNSSSGGIFTLIAEKILDNDGVVFGAIFNDDFEVEHTYVQTKEELEKFRGSKYVQSKIGNTYKDAKEFLESGRQVLFSGTPCQIAGLKSFLSKDYKNLICIDIICHGVPSPMVWKKYISYRENIAGSRTKRIAFRKKNEGWKQFSISFQFKNDIEYCKTVNKDLFMRAFLKNLCLRPSCYDCNFKGTHRLSDITLADFWGIEKILPELDDDRGTSLIFINSTAGNGFFEEIKNNCTYRKVNIDGAIKYNPSAIKSVNDNPKRESFFKNLDQMPFDQLVNKYCSEEFYKLIISKLKRNLKRIINF